MKCRKIYIRGFYLFFMTVDFHDDMDRYLAGKIRKKVFSGFKSKIMNKKAVVSYKAMNKFGDLKNKVVSKVDSFKNKKKEDKEISQDDINNLVEKKGVDFVSRPIVRKAEPEDDGWEEVDLGKLKVEGRELNSLEVEKKKIQENLVKMHDRRELEEEKIVRLSAENEKRESEEEKAKRLALGEEVKILKEKQRIEEDRLSQLRKARRREQMDSLRGRVTDILFKKMPKKEKDMGEEVRKEIRREAKVEAAKNQRDVSEGEGKPKEEVVKVEREVLEQKEEIQKAKVEYNEELKEAKEVEYNEEIQESKEVNQLKKELREAKEIIQLKEELKEAKEVELRKELEEAKEIIKNEKKKEVKKIESKKEKKIDGKKQSFLSKFIQIRTSEQLAREEEERLKMEEAQALNDQAAVNNLFEDKEEVMSNVPKEEDVVNDEVVGDMSSLFPDEQKVVGNETPDSGSIISLDDDYKIKVVRNG